MGKDLSPIGTLIKGVTAVVHADVVATEVVLKVTKGAPADDEKLTNVLNELGEIKNTHENIVRDLGELALRLLQ